MATYVTPKRAAEFIFYVSLRSQANTKIHQVNPTLAAGDVKISKDGGAEANLATLPVVTPAGSKRVKVTVSATEMAADQVQITFSDAAGAEWCDLTINIQTTASQIDDLALAATALSTAQWTGARAGYLDNLNVGGLVASSAEATAIQNNTRVVRVVPDVIERPDSGTSTYRVELLLYDDTGNMEAPDSAPTIDLVNQAGTSRNSRLDSTTMALVSTGRYRAIYTADAADALEQLVWTFSVIEGAATRLYGNASLIVDTTAVDFTSADRTKLDTLHDTRLTAARATNLDNLDAAVSTRATPAQVKTQADQSLVDIHLDHLLQTDTPSPLPGTAGAILKDLLEDDAGTWRYTANALEQAPAGGGAAAAITILPIAATVSAGEVSAHGLVAYQEAGFTYTFSLVDSASQPVNVSGKSLSFIAAKLATPNTVAWSLTTGAGEITIAGLYSNQVTVVGTESKTPTPETLKWVLRNTTDDKVLAVGTLEVRAAPGD